MGDDEIYGMELHETCMFPVLSGGRMDEVLRVAIPLVAEGGWPAVTPRAVAEPLGYTRQCVHQWFGSQHQLRQRFAEIFFRRYTSWATARIHAYGPVGLLPDDPEALSWVKCWWAMREASHRDALLSELVSAAREEEQRILRRRTPDRAEEQVEALHALAESFQLRMCQAGETDAADVLGRARSALLALPPPRTVDDHGQETLDSP